MDTHLENSDDDQTLSPDSVDLEHSSSDGSPETLDDDFEDYEVPEYINVHGMADPSDSSIWVDTKSFEDDDTDGNLICPSPLNSYSGYSYRPWGYKWGEPWPAFDTFRPWNSSSPVWFDEKPSSVGAGLSNLGNTCFLNAIVQCFTHTVPLVEGVRTYDHATPCDRYIDGFCLICAFRAHFEIALGSTERVVSPWKLVDNLSYFSSSFQRYQQEDAHEFLQCFLDRLESSCSDSMSKEISCEMKDNFVKQAFGGHLVSKLKCCNCGHVSDTYEPSIDLSLEIKDVTTLQAALESFTKLEKIEDHETKFTCEKCKEEVSIEKQLLLEETPSVAAFHLKRFKNDGSYVEKIEKHVEFPLELDLQPYTNSCQNSDAELRYELYAIVVHNGFSANSGHYYCFIRSAPDTWYKFDDSQVFRVQEDVVLLQEAYILFYAKQGTPWFSTYLETIKPISDLHSSNTSPKSVLDNVDIRTSYPNHATNCHYDVNGTSDAALDNILESPSGSRDDQVDGINYKDDTQQMSTTLPLGDTSPVDNSINEIKDKNVTHGVTATLPSGTSISLKDNCDGMKAFSPPVLQDCSLNQDDVRNNDDNPQTPPRSSSPDIYRDESGDVESYSKPNHHQLVKQVSTKKQSQKELESSETEEAQRLLKTFPSARRKSLSAAMSGSLGEDLQMNKRRKIMEVSPNDDDSPSTTHRKASLRSLARPLAAGCFR